MKLKKIFARIIILGGNKATRCKRRFFFIRNNALKTYFEKAWAHLDLNRIYFFDTEYILLSTIIYTNFQHYSTIFNHIYLLRGAILKYKNTEHFIEDSCKRSCSWVNDTGLVCKKYGFFSKLGYKEIDDKYKTQLILLFFLRKLQIV